MALKMITVAAVAAALREVHEAEKKPFLVDVRGADEWVSPLGHVAGSTLLPLPEISTANIEKLAKDVGARPLIVVCRSGGRARSAAQAFADSGRFSSVAVMEGGMLAWNSAGLPIDRSRA
jgi:sulfur dioxygenase